MILEFAMDVVAGPPRPMTLILIGWVLAVVLIEWAVLAAMGMRPASQALVRAGLVNLASLGAAFIIWILLSSGGLDGTALIIGAFLCIVIIQGVILSSNRLNLSQGKAWVAAVAMKTASAAASILAIMLIDL